MEGKKKNIKGKKKNKKVGAHGRGPRDSQWTASQCFQLSLLLGEICHVNEAEDKHD